MSSASALLPRMRRASFNNAQQLRHEERPAGFGCLCIQCYGDVGMVHHHQCLPLGLDTRNDLFGVHAQLDDLERNATTGRLGLLGDINHAAAAFADFLHDFVTPDLLADGFVGDIRQLNFHRRFGRPATKAASQIPLTDQFSKTGTPCTARLSVRPLPPRLPHWQVPLDRESRSGIIRNRRIPLNYIESAVFAVVSFSMEARLPPWVACVSFAIKQAGTRRVRQPRHLRMNSCDGNLQTQPEEWIRFERLLADLSARFVGLPAEALDREIEEAQRRICETLGLDRSTLGQPSEAGVPQFTHAWAIPGCLLPPRSAAAALVPWVTRQIQGGLTLRFSSVDELPPEAATDKETLRRVGTKSFVAFPLLVGGKAMGALSFGTVKAERQWPDELVNRLRLIAEVFAGALERRSSEKALQKALTTVEALKERLEAENISLRQDLQLLEAHPQLLGRSAALRNTLAQAEQVAATDATVLLLGETGTGKELIASAIHDLSARRGRRMLRVNCAAIPSTLVESELFGREKGAYTGALTKQIGRFEAAHGSTLFLDEIGELPSELQGKLLRVLEDRQIERLGSSTPIPVDVRIIAATNADLETAVRKGRFRQDLFYRLNVFPITVPPLRDRLEDIPLLVRAFVEQFSKVMGKTITSISQSNLDALLRYPWPGNVRELRNVIERAVILCQGPKLTVQVPKASQSMGARSLAMKDAEREHILHVLEQTGWRVQGNGGAAEILGLKRTSLESRMARLGIRRPKPVRPHGTEQTE